jgi:hypothetical protein
MRAAFTSWIVGTILSAIPVTVSFGEPSWTVVSTPNRGTLANGLNAVAAVSDSVAFAAGHYYEDSAASYRTMVQHWDGRAWRIVDSPSLGRGYNDLYAVAATSAMDAWAVGYWRPTNDTDYRPLVLHWDGAAWRSQSLPMTQAGQLLGVAAVAPNDVWAVGSFTDTGGARALALHWNGGRWTRVNVPGPAAARYAILNGVSASPSGDVWAVGNAYVEGRYVTLTEHWDGARWTMVPSPNAGTKANRLRAVAVSTASEAWAVGDAVGVGGVILRWDGSAWQLDAHVRNATGSTTLYGVVTPGPGEAWVVGYARDSGAIRATAHWWNGAGWNALTMPAPSPSTVVLGAGLRDGLLWAVGLRNAGGTDRTLSLRARIP